MNCELNSEPVFANLPIKKLSKTQRNRVSLQFTDRVFGTPLTRGVTGKTFTDTGKKNEKK